MAGEHLVKSRAALDWVLAQHPRALVMVSRKTWPEPDNWLSVRGSTMYLVHFHDPADVPDDDDDLRWSWPDYDYAIAKSGAVYPLEPVYSNDSEDTRWRVTAPEIWRASWSARRRSEAQVQRREATLFALELGL